MNVNTIQDLSDLFNTEIRKYVTDSDMLDKADEFQYYLDDIIEKLKDDKINEKLLIRQSDEVEERSGSYHWENDFEVLSKLDANFKSILSWFGNKGEKLFDVYDVDYALIIEPTNEGVFVETSAAAKYNSNSFFVNYAQLIEGGYKTEFIGLMDAIKSTVAIGIDCCVLIDCPDNVTVTTSGDIDFDAVVEKYADT